MIHTIEKLSAGQAAAAGGIGSGISIATVISLDPLALTTWLRVATLAVGLLTGLVSLAIVMKLVQQLRDMRSRRA
jgi:Kef-type K+ transport system membrane component KefB